MGRPACSQRSEHRQQVYDTARESGGPYLVAHYKPVHLAEVDHTLGLGWVAASHPGRCMVLAELAHDHSWVAVKVVIVGAGRRRKLEVLSRSAGAAEVYGGRTHGYCCCWGYPWGGGP